MEARAQRKQDKRLIKISKSIAYITRHGAEKEGVPITDAGYIKVDDLLKHKLFINVDTDTIINIVKNNEKKRFELITDNDILFIRAAQGHSLRNLDANKIMKPIKTAKDFEGKIIVHGSYFKFWNEIGATGLKTMSRNHIHFAIGYKGDDSVISGMRGDCDMFIELDLEFALEQRTQFYISSNNVILTPGINGILSPVFFKKVYRKVNKKTELIFSNDDLKSLLKEHAYKYLMVLDFEANCINGQRMNPQEIIEFPFIPVRVEDRKIMSDLTFHQYVKPKHYDLTDFCTQLTGITQETVNKAKHIEDVLKDAEDFIKQTKIDPKDICFITCGDFDFRCLNREATYKKIQYNNIFKRYINIKQFFNTAFGHSGRTSMVDMLNMCKLDLEGRHHSGIDDTKNIAKVLVEILKTDLLPLKSYTRYV